MISPGAQNSESTDLNGAEWTPQLKQPNGLRLENLRKTGTDEVRLHLDVSRLQVLLLASTAGLATGLLVAGAYTGFPAAGLLAAAALITFTALKLRKSPPAWWQLSVVPSRIDTYGWSILGRQMRSRSVELSRIEGIGIERRTGSRAACLKITTDSETVLLGEGLSDGALNWLKNYLVVEFAGLTWRPIDTVGKRAISKANAATAPNPVMLKPDLALRLIAIFLAQAPGVVAKLRAAVDAGSPSEIRGHAHWLKSSSANVGARHLSELSQLVEHCAIDRDLAYCTLLCGEIETALPGVIDWLKDIRNSAENKISELTARAANTGNPIQTDKTEIRGGADKFPIPGRVLVVDDSAVSIEIASEFLSEMVETVEFARDGIAAVEAWKNGQFDLIFMDCEMIRMNGFEATAEIRKQESERGIDRVPIVALTGSVFKNDREKCLAAGMDDYVAKPYAPDCLKAVLEKWLGHLLTVKELRAVHEEMTNADEPNTSGAATSDPEKRSA